MTSYLVLTVIGDDKPGLVESLAKVIAQNSGSWLESSMSQLAGKFAGILKVSVADSDANDLVSALDSMDWGLKMIIERVGHSEAEGAPLTVELSVVGNDRKGIVKEISQALASMAINVEKLNTSCSPAPMSGVDLFTAKATIKVPSNLDLESLKNQLEQLADDMIVDIELT